MGSNRAIPASASAPSMMMQTHIPSGSNSPPFPVLDSSCSIKTEPSAHLDAPMNAHCHSENWAESYQDLSSWCSATSASSPAICQSPVTDETVVSEIDFQGEIDFDLRKSEEIASIPLEEDCSFNLWGSGSPLLADSASPSPPVRAAISTGTSEPVLLNDCWLFEFERDKVVGKPDSSRPQTLTSTSTSSTRTNLVNEIQSTNVNVKEEVLDTKENMNPIMSPQALLSDPIKMAELQLRLERIASHTHPGVNSKSKAADLMKILQEQIAELNKKRYKSPAAVSDLHNYHSRVQSIPSTSSAGTQPLYAQAAVSSAPMLSENSDDIFQSDPFDGLFSSPEVQIQQVEQPVVPQVSVGNVSHQILVQNLTAAPVFVSSNFLQPNSLEAMSHMSTGGPSSGNGDLFSQAHHEVMRQSSKMHQSHPQHQNLNQSSHLQLPVSASHQQQTFQPMYQAPQVSSSHHPVRTIPVKNEGSLTLQLPTSRVNMPELDLNFDALIFGTSGSTSNSCKVSAISTPEVLKPLVETPDPESFDLLSYLCDDKVSTPTVYLENNPFQFPHSTASLTTLTTSSVTDRKSNVMVVKPMAPQWAKKAVKIEQEDKKSAVVVEVKPQIMPTALSDVEEEKEDVKNRIMTRVVEPVKEEQVSPRLTRSPRKWKYSDDFVFSPTPSEESAKPSRRRRTPSSKYDSDEDFTLPVKKSRKRSAAPIIEEDDDDDDEDQVKRKKPRAAVERRGERTVSTSSESDRYRELRDRNNEASRKSRLTRKAREVELAQQAEVLTKDNRILKVKVEEMENLVKKLREALLQSMMKKT